MDQNPTPPPPQMPWGAPPAPVFVPEPELKPLDKLPLPPFVIFMAIVTGVAFVLGLARFPHSLGNGLAYERGVAKLTAGDAKGAAAILEPLHKDYPADSELRIQLIRADIGSENLAAAAQLLQSFEGQKVSKEEEAELTEAANQFESKARELGMLDDGDKK